MNIAEHKLKLFRQIDQLSEESLIALETIIANLMTANQLDEKRQLVGSMKNLVIHIAEDFDAPLDDFKEYM